MVVLRYSDKKRFVDFLDKSNSKNFYDEKSKTKVMQLSRFKCTTVYKKLNSETKAQENTIKVTSLEQFIQTLLYKS